MAFTPQEWTINCLDSKQKVKLASDVEATRTLDECRSLCSSSTACNIMIELGIGGKSVQVDTYYLHWAQVELKSASVLLLV